MAERLSPEQLEEAQEYNYMLRAMAEEHVREWLENLGYDDIDAERATEAAFDELLATMKEQSR